MEDTLTILGCGWNLFEDIKKHGIHGDVMGVNRTVIDYSGHLKHACIIDYKAIGEPLLTIRKILKGNMDFTVHKWAKKVIASFGHIEEIGVVNSYVGYCDINVNEWNLEPRVQFSGMLAMLVGRELGYKKLNVLGCPGDKKGHYYDIKCNQTFQQQA
jgi:hypothetical protein